MTLSSSSISSRALCIRGPKAAAERACASDSGSSAARTATAADGIAAHHGREIKEAEAGPMESIREAAAATGAEASGRRRWWWWKTEEEEDRASAAAVAAAAASPSGVDDEDNTLVEEKERLAVAASDCLRIRLGVPGVEEEREAEVRDGRKKKHHLFASK